MKKGSILVLKVIFMKVFKDTHVKFKLSVPSIFACCEIRTLQLVDCSDSQLQDRRLWNNRRLQWFRAQMFIFTLKAD